MQSTFGTKAWSLNAALNWIGRYTNTAVEASPPIGSWTTLDINASLNVEEVWPAETWRGTSLSLTLLNALNRDPPFALNPPPNSVAGYDPTNANPLGRFAAFEVHKKW